MNVRPALAALAAFVLVLAVPLAPALAGGSPIVESHTGARPADADALLGPVAAELAAAGFTGARATAREVDAKLSRAGRATDDAALDAATARIEAGYRLVVSGEFERALTELDGGLAALRAAPASLAGNDRRRDALMRGLVGLALSHKRLGRSLEATSAMAELVRSFPDREISYKDYGPEPRDLFTRVVRDLKQDGLATLTVEVDDPTTVVFLNERYAGAGTVTTPDLYPGTYRVYLQQGARRGRVHEIDVDAGGSSTVALSWALDAALRTEDGVAALVFGDNAERRDHESRLAVRIGRALDAPSVAVIGFREVAGQRQVVGQVYYVDTRREVRSATVSLDPVKPRVEQLRALGRYLGGDESAADLVEPMGDDSAGAVEAGGAGARDGGGARFGGWRWATLSLGVLALAGGVTLVAIDEDEFAGASRNDAIRNTAPAGYVTGAIGAVVTGLSIYMFARDASAGEPPARAVALTPTDGGALLGLTGVF